MIFIGQASNYTWKSSWRQVFVRGRKKDAEKLERELARRYKSDASRVRLYHSGRSALAAAIIATTPKGSKILVPGLTCIAVVRAVRAAGCEPEYCDIDPDNLQYDLKELAKKIKSNPEIRGIIIQNTLGVTIDIERVKEIIKGHKIAVIEDLAHAAGRFYANRQEVGTMGDVTVLSFGKGKTIDVISGGALVFRNLDLVMPNQPSREPRRADQWRDRWYPVLGRWIRFWYHLGLGKIFTGVLLKLHWIQKSADAALDLDVKLPNWQAGLAFSCLKKRDNAVDREWRLVERREELLRELESHGFYLNEIWYDTPVSPERYKKEAGFPDKECPKTVQIASQIINIPMWYSEKQLALALEIIKKYEVKSDE